MVLQQYLLSLPLFSSALSFFLLSDCLSSLTTKAAIAALFIKSPRDFSHGPKNKKPLDKIHDFLPKTRKDVVHFWFVYSKVYGHLAT
ncbi:hypothetical protein ACFXTH_001251 [Malus domestica]